MIKNICIFGMGGVGGFYGGKMALAVEAGMLAGRRVYFIARGEHLHQIQQKGLILNTSRASGLICKPALATDNIEELAEPPDLILISVKAYDLAEALDQMKPVIQPHTLILPLLNGVDIYQRIRNIIKTGIVLPACVWIGAYIQEPGLVVENGGARMALGKDPAYPDFDPTPLLELLNQTGLRYQWLDDPYAAIWEKYTLVAAFALVTARHHLTMGRVLENPMARQQVTAVMEEIVLLANREGVALHASIVGDILAKAATFPPENTTSYQRDVAAKGHKNEGDIFGGTILQLGRKHGVPTPVTEALYREIQERLDQETYKP